MEFFIYLIGILDSLCNVLGACAVIAGGITVLLGLFIMLSVLNDNFSDGEKKIVIPAFRKSLISLVIFMLLSIAVPNSKTVAAMIIIPCLTENTHILNITEGGLKALEILAKQWAEELVSKEKDKK